MWKSKCPYSKQNGRPPKYSSWQSTSFFWNHAKSSRKLTMWVCSYGSGHQNLWKRVECCFLSLFEKYFIYWSLVCASMGRWWVKSACRRRSVQSTGPWSAACPLRPWSVHGPRPKNVRQALSCDRVELNMPTWRGQKPVFPYRCFNHQVFGEEGI